MRSLTSDGPPEQLQNGYLYESPSTYLSKDARLASTDTLTVSVTAAVHGSEKAAGPLCKVVIPLVSTE
jgi:hypothetical protein